MRTRSIVVTGAFGTLGAAVAHAFARQGCVVTLLDAAPGARNDLVAAFGKPHALLAGLDLTDLAATRAALDAVAAERGIDVLVNVAGGFRWELVSESDLTAWDQMYATNLKTCLVTSRAALAHLKVSRGRIVNIGAAAAAQRSAAGMGAYAASKAGVHRLTESLADELKDAGVNVNAVMPGTIDTPANRRDMPQADVSRWVTPDAIADVVLFLASDAARAVTGALVPVMGRA